MKRLADAAACTENVSISICTVRLSWPQHLQNARLLELCGPEQRGTALGLMGVALLMLAEDLLEGESQPKPEQSN